MTRVSRTDRPARKPRRTREEKKAEIRAALIDAAQELFAKHGYFGVSLDEIADQVGVTKGAIYSNFNGKEDLLLEVLGRLSFDLDPSLLTDPTVRLPDLLRVIAKELARQTTSDEIRQIAPREMELSVLAFTNTAIRDLLVSFARNRERFIAALLTERAAKDGIELALPATELAAILNALGQGLTRLRFMDPDRIPESYFEDAIALFVPAADRKRKPR